MIDPKKIYWLRESTVPNPSLEGRQEAETVIVGGGFAGLATALHLKARRPEMSITLLERRFAGYGASGRNFGLTPNFLGNRVVQYHAAGGLDLVRRLYQNGNHALALLERLLRDHQIDCDYRTAGSLLIARTDDHLETLNQQAAIYRDIGADIAMLDAEQAMARFSALPLKGALALPTNRTIDPGKLVRGMKQAAQNLGVEIFENSPVRDVRPGDVNIVATDQGQISCRNVVLATGTYGDPMGILRNKVRPIFSLVVVTEPLNDAQWQAMGWPNRENIYSPHHTFWNLRATVDGRIVFIDSTRSKIPLSRNADIDFKERDFARQKTWLRQTFPVLANINFSHSWGGPIGLTVDQMPVFGRAPGHENIYYAGGFNGRGVLMTHLAGEAIAAMITGGEAEAMDLANRKMKSFPPEPFAWLGIKAVFAKMRRQREDLQ